MINFYKYGYGLDEYDKYGVELAKLTSRRRLTSRRECLYVNTLHIIKRTPRYALWYSKTILGGRWLEAEPFIMKDPNWVITYANEIINGRWPEAEPYIMKDSYQAYLYARYIMGERWLEAEQYIKLFPVWWDAYCARFGIYGFSVDKIDVTIRR